ncbi:MAG: hypothetical protein A2901_01945 [Elusimicrobia bacterium RIFCSPLOWO2_01_FULL_54_10]|nr:MAG: hypothetical protein A2901_01945 [Elusimicrobia bacterium RIFCSPLOWO2_01_FULL_54_10]
MTKNRLEAFSDGVIAIIITIMVLELKTPEGETIEAVLPMAHVFLSYVLSFVFLGIYWNNHHHMLHAVQKVNGSILWANLHLLFWLSLIPWVTSWMGENHFASQPVAIYGAVLLMAAISYYILAHALVNHHGVESSLGRALGSDFKGKISVVLYALAIPLSFALRWAALGIYIGVAIMWLVPDRRIEKILSPD